MGKSSKKRPYTTKDDRESNSKKTRNGAEEEEDVTGASENDNDQNFSGEESKHEETVPKANKKKKGKTNGEESKQSDEPVSNVAKRLSKICKDKRRKVSRKAREQGNNEKLEVEAILTYTVGDFKRKYCVKLKDNTRIWLSAQKVTALCPDMLRNYTEALKNGTLVEAITSHKYDKNTKRKYLIKWKDHSKGLTWESPKTASLYCSKMLQAYTEEFEQAEPKVIETKFRSKNKLPKKIQPLQKKTDRLADRIAIKKKSFGIRLSKRSHGKQM